MRRTEVRVDDLDHPQGVAWDPAPGVLWAGGEAGQLYRIDVDARAWSDDGRVYRLVPLHPPETWAADTDG